MCTTSTISYDCREAVLLKPTEIKPGDNCTTYKETNQKKDSCKNNKQVTVIDPWCFQSVLRQNTNGTY